MKSHRQNDATLSSELAGASSTRKLLGAIFPRRAGPRRELTPGPPDGATMCPAPGSGDRRRRRRRRRNQYVLPWQREQPPGSLRPAFRPNASAAGGPAAPTDAPDDASKQNKALAAKSAPSRRFSMTVAQL